MVPKNVTMYERNNEASIRRIDHERHVQRFRCSFQTSCVSDLSDGVDMSVVQDA